MSKTFLPRPSFVVNIMVRAVLVILISSGLARGQGGPTGAIDGTVQDASGAVVPGAEVQIISSATGGIARAVVTDTGGSFNALLLPAGSYMLVIHAQGFSEA